MLPGRSGPGSSAQNALTLDGDDYNDGVFSRLNQAVRNYNPARQVARDLEEGPISQEFSEGEAELAAQDYVDLTADDDDPARQPPLQLRHLDLQEEQEFRYEEFKWEGLIIKRNSCYSIIPVTRFLRVEFLRVTQICFHPAKGHFVRGFPYARNRSLIGKLPRKQNEVFAVYEIQDDDPRPHDAQALLEMPVSQLRTPQRLHITNAAYPKHRRDARISAGKEDVERNGLLCCRWKHFVHFHDAHKRADRTPAEWALVAISADDIREGHLEEDANYLRDQWRQCPTVLGGDHTTSGMPDRAPLEAQAGAGGAVGAVRAPGQRYSVFDAFCGAGGASRGADSAGFHVRYAIDSWDRACESYRVNFPNTKLAEQNVFDFIIQNHDTPIRADVLHLSPPCQVWSPAHTVQGVNDETNVAALFACRSLTEKVRPRIVTLEQTFGILNQRFWMYFGILVLGFTEQGYSLRWKVINCSVYGLPQRRKRLVMIGAGPGEHLPSFPPHTHSETGRDGLKRFTTIRQAVSKVTPWIRRNDPLHKEISRAAPNDAVLGDPDGILPRCMTTSGGQNYHFNGERPYTNREFALLQGFPAKHYFTEKCAKKQIGNAFPPVVVQALYEHIQRHLHEHDGFSGDPKPRPCTSNPLPIEIEGDDLPPRSIPDGMGFCLRARSSRPWPRSGEQVAVAGISRDLPIIIEELDQEMSDVEPLSTPSSVTLSARGSPATLAGRDAREQTPNSFSSPDSRSVSDGQTGSSLERPILL